MEIAAAFSTTKLEIETFQWHSAIWHWDNKSLHLGIKMLPLLMSKGNAWAGTPEYRHPSSTPMPPTNLCLIYTLAIFFSFNQTARREKIKISPQKTYFEPDFYHISVLPVYFKEVSADFQQSVRSVKHRAKIGCPGWRVLPEGWELVRCKQHCPRPNDLSQWQVHVRKFTKKLLATCNISMTIRLTNPAATGQEPHNHVGLHQLWSWSKN